MGTPTGLGSTDRRPGRAVGPDRQLPAALELNRGDVDRQRVMAAVLLDHHPTFRSETGPMTGCRCGGVGLGQSVTLHVAAALAAALDGGQPDRGPQCASEHPAGWRCEHRAGHSDTTEDQHRNGGVVWGGGDRG